VYNKNLKYGSKLHRRKFKKSEFIPKSDDPDKFQKALERFNKRIKHIVENYIKFPEAGIGASAKSFEEYFDLIATFFNTGNGGNAIYKHSNGDLIPVHLKLVYNNSDEIDLPFPNFIHFIEGVRVFVGAGWVMGYLFIQ